MYRRFKKILFVFAILLLISGCQQSAPSVEEDDYTPVEVRAAIPSSIAESTILSGRTMPDKDVMIVPSLPGKVERVNVAIGDWVKAGTVLFTLDNSNLEQQLSQAEAALNSAYANFQMTADQIAGAQATFERMKALYDSGAISRSQYEQAELAASTQPLEAAQGALTQAETAYEAARDAYNDAAITAPISGYVSAINIEAGEMASNAQPAMIIVDIDPLIIRLGVTENLVNKLAVGDDVAVTIPAVEYETEGEIISISPIVDSVSLLYPVEVLIDNKANSVKASMFAEVKIVTKYNESAIIVPSDAVLVKNGNEIVYTVIDNLAVEHVVQTGIDNGQDIEILTGISEGDVVIITGQHYVTDGSKIKVIRGE